MISFHWQLLAIGATPVPVEEVKTPIPDTKVESRRVTSLPSETVEAQPVIIPQSNPVAPNENLAIDEPSIAVSENAASALHFGLLKNLVNMNKNEAKEDAVTAKQSATSERASAHDTGLFMNLIQRARSDPIADAPATESSALDSGSGGSILSMLKNKLSTAPLKQSSSDGTSGSKEPLGSEPSVDIGDQNNSPSRAELLKKGVLEYLDGLRSEMQDMKKDEASKT